MKYHVSDLLDPIRVQDVELNSQTPLSSQRIKEMTMKKVNMQRRPRRSLGFKILVAAAIVASVSITALAAEKSWGAGDVFRDVLNGQLEKDQLRAELEELEGTYRDQVSENQLEVVNQLGQAFEEKTYTDQGTTIRVNAAYSDEYVVNLYLSVTAPENTVLPDDILYTFYDYSTIMELQSGDYMIGNLPGNAPYPACFTSMEVEALPDENPADNQKDFRVTVFAQPGEKTKFNDGYSKALPIAGIYQQVPNVEDDEDGYTRIAPCNIQIDLTMSHPVKQVELAVKGLKYGGEKTRTWTHDSPCLATCEENLTGETDPETGLPIHTESWEYTVTAERFQISPMCVSWECSYTSSDRQKKPWPGLPDRDEGWYQSHVPSGRWRHS